MERNRRWIQRAISAVGAGMLGCTLLVCGASLMASEESGEGAMSIIPDRSDLI